MASSSSTPIKRNGTAPKPSTTTTPTTTTTTTTPAQPPTNRLTALLPTPLETLLLTTYPTTLLLGSLFSLLDPTARRAPYSPLTQSHPPAFAPSYFARKDNIFNVFFVKIAWFWISVAFFVFWGLHGSMGGDVGLVLTPRRLRAAVRWALVTGWWGAVTQWFFGPGLVDRGFRVTGGMEVGGQGEGEGGWRTGIVVPTVVGGLSWWMLLMTAAYFHTWFEKLTGLLTAFAGVFVVYFLPRALPAMRDIIGMPGV
ncbi:inositol phospholipid synthesis and fat-storage-inducing TM-domain-containing protein [Usnea florida]